MKANSDVVIIGGGIAGITTAYFLGKLGVKSTVIEKENIGAHASGLAYGGIGAVSDEVIYVGFKRDTGREDAAVGV